MLRQVTRSAPLRAFSTLPAKDVACELAASSIRFGTGVTKEVGMDLKEMKAKHVVVFTDPKLKEMPVVKVVMDSLAQNGIIAHLYDQVRVEPNDHSFKHAIDYMLNHPAKIDAIVGVGGGSVLDTAKIANLYSMFPPEDFYDYVNPPVGKGMPVPGALLPFIAIPTTAGTGSETTGVAIFDDTRHKAKTGVASRRLKPTLGIVDPDNTATLPPNVAKYSGFDVLCHSIESYTALPFTERPHPGSPVLRPAYQGSNPISDIWSLHALQQTTKYLRRAVADPSDVEARSAMILASTSAGIGFGNAGVHLCHGMSYPIAAQVRKYVPPGYECDHPMVPHGHSVVVTAPAVFRFTGSADPERHMTCAKTLAWGTDRVFKYEQMSAAAIKEAAGEILADEVLRLMSSLDVPLGLEPLGYTKDDIPMLVKGTLPQHRVTKLAPRPAGEEELSAMFENAMAY
ncbi:hypothetical protein SPRG_14119 [Saprolegnia parasitica CBS 223.65]|uniref:hydroxyacid-oxoacid transhydrogenase n=1 Tax=Saprolegnia parasitica (strain CBS 223.65) TaxID=695850 RepID=A0A067BRK4_SAPPC|nr:hypothetical protein SPRG_14119 [Saprolegnia parasitica CBS 223.65]KDO20888.1 hypothetical protein SPRG_14119 [Saprolegnia parasitica CBS 223.65]|eukprot:XP_012208377.1 hypothetical protein SPRG_14119 [Saprolegnia parasitica CBS 223.65]